jgi:hypothetical protein
MRKSRAKKVFYTVVFEAEHIHTQEWFVFRGPRVREVRYEIESEEEPKLKIVNSVANIDLPGSSAN